jgi:hypothetical protein
MTPDAQARQVTLASATLMRFTDSIRSKRKDASA